MIGGVLAINILGISGWTPWVRVRAVRQCNLGYFFGTWCNGFISWERAMRFGSSQQDYVLLRCEEAKKSPRDHGSSLPSLRWAVDLLIRSAGTFSCGILLFSYPITIHYDPSTHRRPAQKTWAACWKFSQGIYEETDNHRHRHCRWQDSFLGTQENGRQMLGLWCNVSLQFHSPTL